MTHLRIEQNTSSNEHVTSDIIHKLYETAKAIIDEETLNEIEESQVSLEGSLVVDKAYGDEIDWLTNTFKNKLYITAGARYIRFADDAVANRMIALYSGDNIGVTSTDLSGVTTLDYRFRGDLTAQIQTFDELGDIRSITSLGTFCFGGCSNLRSIDLSNIQYLGGEALRGTALSGVINLPNVILIGDNVRGNALGGCTGITQINFGQSFSTIVNGVNFADNPNLTTITGFDNITAIPYRTFYNCSSLLTITSLSNTLTVNSLAFHGCTNLQFPSEVTVDFMTSEPFACFRGCKGLTKVILGNSVTGLGADCFNMCSNLTEIVGLDRITTLSSYALSTYAGVGTLDLSSWTSRFTRNSGDYANSHLSYITDMPYITKVLIGDIDFEFNASGWSVILTYRLVFVNMPVLTCVDFKSMVKFPNMSNGERCSLFSNCPNMRTFILRNTSVCPLANTDRVVEPLDIGGSNVTLYVPDAILVDYKTAAGWSNISSQIKGISELPST